MAMKSLQVVVGHSGCSACSAYQQQALGSQCVHVQLQQLLVVPPFAPLVAGLVAVVQLAVLPFEH